MIRLVIGCGYLGARVAALWSGQGDTVIGVTRQSSRAEEFAARGWQPLVADVMQPESLYELPAADTVLFAVARGREPNVSIRDLHVSGIRNVLAACGAAPAHFVYVSSTGVYGQNDGSWIDESSACVPQREGGQACLEAEQILAANLPRGGATILRMAGLYGPGRVPRKEDLLAGRASSERAEGWLNLIHVDDAAAVVVRAAAIRSAMNGQGSEPPRDRVRLFNVSDGTPVVRQDYLAEIARCLRISLPSKIASEADAHDQAVVKSAADGAAAVRDRVATSKRISNRRLIAELGVALRYPSFREGLSAILSDAAE